MSVAGVGMVAAFAASISRVASGNALKFAFELSGTDQGFARFWLVHADGTVDMCLKHPGFDEDLKVTADIRRFVETCRGFRSLEREIARGAIRLDGPARLKRAFPAWLRASPLASHPRCRSGPEQALDSRTRAAKARAA
jgi:hypothetical protein